jgi:LEA14-like dessication related protein
MRTYLYLVLLALALMASCAQPKPLIYKDVERVSFKKADFTSVTLKVELKLYNPNKYALMLKDPLLEIYINDKHVGYASIDDKLAIPARDTFIVPAMLRIDLLNAIPNAIQVIRNKEITLRVDGSLKAGIPHHVGKGGIFVGVPVHYEGKQKIDIKL